MANVETTTLTLPTGIAQSLLELLTAALSGPSLAVRPDSEPKTAREYVAAMKLGTQAEDFMEMPYEAAGYVNAITAADMDQMKAAGLDHLRIPANCAYRADVNGVIPEAFLLKLDAQIHLALTRFDRVIVDPLHHYWQWKGANSYAQYATDSAAVGKLTADQHAVRATAMWKQLATRYKDYSLRLSFDLFNEPNAPSPALSGIPAGLTAEQMNAWYASVIPVIRATGGNNALRMILLEPYGFTGMVLEMPKDAGNVGASAHCYAPLNYTHGVDPLTPATLSAFKASMVFYQKWAKANNVPMWIGEAGASANVSASTASNAVARPVAERAEFYAHIRNVALSLGIPVCYWGHNAAFPMIDAKTRQWLPGMLEAIKGTLPVRAYPEFIQLTGGRLKQEYFINGVSKGFTYDPATGTLSAPANITTTDQLVTVVFPDIPVANGQAWIVRADEFVGQWELGNAPYVYKPTTADQNRRMGIDDRALNMAGKAIYPGWKPAAPGGFENVYAGIASTGTFLGVDFTLKAGSPAGFIRVLALRTK